MIKAVKLFWICLMLTPVLVASEIDFRAVAPATVSLGEHFRLSFQLNARPADFQAPALGDFRVLSGPNQTSSSSTQNINGRVTRQEQYTFTYLLEASREGTFTVAPAVVNVSGNRYTSNTITIQVVRGSSAPTQSSPAQADTRQAQPPTQAGKDDLFIRAIPSKNNPYQGEELIVSYKLYTRVHVNQYSIDKLPSYHGFWSENITAPGQPATQTEVINGQTYHVAEIRRVALYAQRSGEIRIEPLDVACVISLPAAQQRRSIWDDFFGGSPFDQRRTVRQNFQSNALTLNVRPLPTQNRPPEFTGLVGTGFSIAAELNPTELKVNDAATLKVSISGNGNLRMLEKPAVVFPANLEVFDPGITDNIRTTTSGMSGSRSFEYLMIPRTGGEYDIPALKLAYFDPVSGTYIIRASSEFRLQVSGEAGATAGSLAGASQEDIQVLGSDIRFIDIRPLKAVPAGQSFYGSAWFRIAYIIPLLLFAGFLIFWRNHIRLQANSALLRNRKAEKMAQKRLKLARKYMDQQNEQSFYDEIFRTLWGYLSDKLNIPLSILNRETVSQAFRAKKVSEEMSESFINTLDACEFARFAPGEKDSRLEEIYSKAIQTIITIEKELRNLKA